MRAISFVLATLGCIGAALAIDRHWRLWFGDRHQSRRERLLLRAAAGAFLAESLAFCILLDTVGIAIVFWFIEVMAAAIAVGIGFAVKAEKQRHPK